jgi:Rrf2 family protein
MDLTLSRAGDYALRASVCLANAWEAAVYVTIAEVAEDMSLPLSYTPQILGMLARAGLASSRPGRGGGYRLSRPPEAISILDVVEAVEGPLGSVSCPLSGGPCRWDDACAVHPTWSELTSSVRAVLERTSLDRVAREDRELGVSRRRRDARDTNSADRSHR